MRIDRQVLGPLGRRQGDCVGQALNVFPLQDIHVVKPGLFDGESHNDYCVDPSIERRGRQYRATR